MQVVARERSVQPSALLTLPFVGAPVADPLGTRVAFTVARADPEANTMRSALHVLDLNDGSVRELTSGAYADKAPAWSPDGKRLTFISDRGGGAPQLWHVDARGGEPYAGPLVDGAVNEFAVSPDGRRVAVIATPTKLREDIEKRGWRRIDRLRYRADGLGYLDARPVLWIADLDAKTTAPRTDGSGYVGGPAWSPSGTRIAFAGEHRPEADGLFKTELWILDVDGDAPARLRVRMQGLLEAPAWSPEDKALIFFGVDEPGYASGLHNVRLYVIPVERGNALASPPGAEWDCGVRVVGDVDAAGGFPAPMWLDGDRFAAIASWRGCSRLFARELRNFIPLTPETHGVTAFTRLGSHDRFVVLASNASTPPELYDASWTSFTRLTHVTDAWTERTKPRAARKFVVQAPGGPIDAWRIDGAGDAPRPAVLQIHGGPHYAYGQTFFFEFQLLAAAGYDVIYCNPRGSQAYGEPWARAIVGDWAAPAHADIMAALDHAIAEGGIDAKRLGVAGGSYGGYMTAWIAAHEPIFAAAVCMRPATDLTTLWGTSEVGRMLDSELGGRPDEIPEVYRRCSPLTYAANINAPMLIIHSERDYRCPVEQAELLFAALKARGREVELLRFLNTDHGLSRTGPPNERIVRLSAIVDWFDRHLRPEIA